jgi:hypothetical protein
MEQAEPQSYFGNVRRLYPMPSGGGRGDAIVIDQQRLSYVLDKNALTELAKKE